MERRAFRAMGTDVEILLEVGHGVNTAAAFGWVEREFERLEAILSRFRPDSELSRLNADGEIEASGELLTVVCIALEGRRRTGGRFDPTVHDALVAAGYDRSFDELARASRAAATLASPATRGRVHLRGSRIFLDPGVKLDLGGIGKGYAVDRATALLSPVGPCLVNAGGDLAVSGSPWSAGWPVGVDTPQGPLTLAIPSGGLATSGRDRRRWETEGEERHHLIDPATGRPADSDLVTVTVAAASAVEAELLAKSLFLAGERQALREAERDGLAAVLVTEGGVVRRTGAFA
jgi:FAD:protein FMN transferase